MTIQNSDLLVLPANPMRGLNWLFDQVEQTWFDQTTAINSGTHPAIFCADLSVSTTYAFLNSLSDAISQVFPEHARSIGELSRNMSTEQYYGLFGTPAKGTVNLVLALPNLIRFAPAATDTVNGVDLNYQKLLIPKDTTFDVNGYEFAISNGIEIRYNERTGVAVVYDSTTNNPFNVIGTNVLQKEIRSVQGTDYIIINVPVQQLATGIKDNVPSTQGSGCSGTITYTDFLYGIRAFITQNGVKSELNVAYDKAVFDPGIATLTVNLNTTQLSYDFAIPDVYIENGLGVGTVSIYTYTTKGTLSKDFQDVDTREYSTIYRDFRYSAGNLNAYSAPLTTMGGIVWKFNSAVEGGSLPTSFSKIKYGVVTGRRQQKQPITSNNLEGSVSAAGYSAVKAIDYVTSRLYSLTKELPLQSNKDFYSGVNCIVGSNLISGQQLVNSGVVFDNKLRVTIPSGTMFDVTSEVPVLLTKTQVDTIKGWSYNRLVSNMADLTYSYLPYHYVFDMTNNQASIRTYYMDNPSMGVQSFQEENINLGIAVSVDSSTITYENNGYTIRIQTLSDDSFKTLLQENIGVQMSIANASSTTWASVKGELEYKTVDGEYVYKFRLETNFDLDNSDQLHLTNFSQYGTIQPDTIINLTQDFIFVFLQKTTAWNTVIEADSYIDHNLFPTPYNAIIQTIITANIGKRLNYVYNRLRPLIGEGQYQVYLHDIPSVYAEDIYKRVNGELVFDDNNLAVLLHKKGEVIYDDAGLMQLEHRAGDYVKDINGNFVELSARNLSYHWDFVGFDAVYALSLDQYDISFAQNIKDYIANAISGDLALFSDSVIDQTKLVFQPRNKLGYRNVVINNNAEITMKQDLSFEVTYYLTKAGYNNTNLKTSLKTNTPKLINNYLLPNNTIGVSSLVKALLSDVTDDVVDVKINAFSGNAAIDVISSLNALSGFSIRKKLTLGDDKRPSIEEACSVDFLQHAPETIGL